MALEINARRLMSRIEELSRFNRTPGEGVTRFSYSAEDKEARKYLLSLFNAAGLGVSVDGVGNIRARLEGSSPDAPAILSGSHIDTVLHGGKYDGAVGTLGALEAVQTVAESGAPHSHPLEVIIFAEEEGSNFGSTLSGSKALVGKYGVDEMKKLKNPEGTSMYDMAKNAGYEPDSMPSYRLRPETVKAMIELHIEQSVVLESKGISVGIVEAVAGIKAMEIRLKGVSNHAGATPMNLRQDPMVAAAHLIAQVETLAKGTGTGSTVATSAESSASPMSRTSFRARFASPSISATSSSPESNPLWTEWPCSRPRRPSPEGSTWKSFPSRSRLRWRWIRACSRSSRGARKSRGRRITG